MFCIVTDFVPAYIKIPLSVGVTITVTKLAPNVGPICASFINVLQDHFKRFFTTMIDISHLNCISNSARIDPGPETDN